MSDFMPLAPGDPQELGGLELLGRLGHGGQGVVYLARTPMGARVAIKWLRPSDDEESVERFLREAEVARRVAAFCTATVHSTGVEDGRPYIMSEYVEGRSLERVVREDGPLAGGDLERLAIGTATALAAIHEASVVHRDFKPGNVIMGAGGPRVIDFGIARTLGPATMTSSTQIGTPAYMAPEQVMGYGLGPAADMFSWAGTMVFASCGRAPFGTDGTHAVMSRVVREPPDLGALDGRLRELVQQCLAKDPASRPTAMDVIMRLLRNPEPGAHPLVEGTRQAAPDAGRTRRSRAPILVGAGVLIAAVAVVAGIAVPRLLRPTTLPPVAVKSAAAPSPDATTAPPATPVKTTLPGGSITLYERPSDPITLTAYEVYSKKLDEDVDYARQSLRGTFAKYPGNLESLVSPNGRYLAGRPHDYTSDGYDSVLITDRQSGLSSFRVRTVRKPLDTSIRTWSKDSSKILLNLNRKVENKQGKDVWISVGFAVVDVAQNDVAQSKVRVVNVADDSIQESDFGWDGNEEGVVIDYGKDEGLRFFDASGKRTRDMPDVGPLASGTLDIFSPSGKTFVTDCPGGGDGEHCLWDAATGKQVRRFSSDCDKVLGWYDESHLYCWEQDNGTHDEVRVVAFDGKLTHRLLEVPDKLDVSPYFTITPSGS
ncbi:serine/threonine protein kinase [Nonomuraea turkmeniaca]|uniref:Serine/threonine protein kinase n=1 Tax=Nonomuraea turkmeniaca TaxID=103838 RepID=A0A5S4FMV7_9ACTN|nr:serine/threonine-protein kinase [Nonomuraea turkmeniaca]TMR21939.1 serine/threonine protein kinase [Nonomuraea turkmeniaca]